MTSADATASTRAEQLERFRRFRTTRDRTLRNALIEEHRWIAIQAARRFDRRGEPLDDLIQIAQLGVLKAVERFDPEMGVPFHSFAQPTVVGELRRHFRDATWAVRVPRRLKDLHVSIAAATDGLIQRLGRQPSADELADFLGVPVDDILQALEAGGGYRTRSLIAPGDDDDGREISAVGHDDVDLGRADSRLAVRRLLETLPPRERTIVYLRFFGGLSQSEIAERVGTSQVHVSRLLRSTLAQLKERLDDT